MLKWMLVGALCTSGFCHAITTESIRHWADCEIAIICHEIEDIEQVCQYKIDDVTENLAYRYGKLSILYDIMALLEEPNYLIGVGE